MRKILIIGVGGIGSFLVQFLSKSGMYYITASDPDRVEKKNLTYQNYNDSDVGELKVMQSSAHLKHPFKILVKEQLEGYDLVICCADNLDVRRLLYREGFGEDCKNKWLDLRAQGRNGALISYLADSKYSDVFNSGPEGSFSCQSEDYNVSRNPADLHFTNIAIAGIASQWIHRWFNGEEVQDKIIINV